MAGSTWISLKKMSPHSIREKGPSKSWKRDAGVFFFFFFSLLLGGLLRPNILLRSGSVASRGKLTAISTGPGK